MGLGTGCVLKLADRRVNFLGGVSRRLLAYFILFWVCITESFFGLHSVCRILQIFDLIPFCPFVVYYCEFYEIASWAI